MNRTRIRTLSAVASAGILLAALTGCAVSVAEPEESVVDEAVTEEPAETSDTTSVDDADEEDTGASAAVSTEWSETSAEVRDQSIAAATKRVTCNGELVLGAAETGQIVHVDGDCEHLVLDVIGAVVVAGQVGTLDVGGSGSVTFVDGVETLNVTGSGLEVFWLGATPTVDDSGSGNVLLAG